MSIAGLRVGAIVGGIGLTVLVYACRDAVSPPEGGLAEAPAIEFDLAPGVISMLYG
jgi:hypothetical protein